MLKVKGAAVAGGGGRLLAGRQSYTGDGLVSHKGRLPAGPRCKVSYNAEPCSGPGRFSPDRRLLDPTLRPSNDGRSLRGPQVPERVSENAMAACRPLTPAARDRRFLWRGLCLGAGVAALPPAARRPTAAAAAAAALRTCRTGF